MSNAPVVSVTDELIAELDEACCENRLGFMIDASEVRALLAEREELKRTIGQLEARLMLADAHRASTVAICMAEVSAIVSKAGENAMDADRYRWLIRQSWFQSAMDRYDIDDGGMQARFDAETARIIDAAMKS